MSQEKIDHLIINSPYEEPKYYWKRDPNTLLFDKVEGRRPAGYVVATPGANPTNDTGTFVPIPLVDQIRRRVKEWRHAGYSGVTGTTERLLRHWYDVNERREDRRLFFCQLEAIETIIWLAEAPEADHVGVEIPSDGGPFKRLCSKMATGSGKTIDMAMLIAWHTLNKAAEPQNPRYSKNFLAIAPGLTIKRRLQVLVPSNPANFYDEFGLVPAGLRDKMNQAKVLIQNWHVLQWETDQDLAKKKSVDKRGAMSDTAYARSVLRELGNAQNIVVINDEAHHAWRIPPGAHSISSTKEEIEQATVWVGGLDRIHSARGILTAHDFSATPFASIGKRGSEEALYDWIVSDFGLNDAIESGLVKTPRVVIRDDGKLTAEYRSRFYHIYPHVKDDLFRRVPEQTPLPDLVANAYALLGKDWLEAAKRWSAEGLPTPPVMITVANRTETAARVKHAFDRNRFHIDELCAPDLTVHIDSKVLEMAEAEETELPVEETPVVGDKEDETIDEPERKLSKKEEAALLRERVDTVGRVGKPGEKIQNVISVGMLSEGWDAKTVTHIMGLRAFNSQLLCEQVVGRGLRRWSYEVDKETGLFEAEYVNIFGVPFTFMPHEETEDAAPKPVTPKFPVEPDPKKKQFEITWPKVIRVEHVYKPALTLEMSQVQPLYIDAWQTSTLAELAPVVDGQPDVTRVSQIDLEELGRRYRTQKIIFETARDIYDQMSESWKGNKELLLAQVIHLTEQFVTSNKIRINPPLFNTDDMRRRIVITLNMGKVVQHIWEAIRFENTQELVPVFDTERPIRATGDMLTWWTSRVRVPGMKSHINVTVYDSTWEASESNEFDRNENVVAWVKNDHLGFVVHYTFQGVVHAYWPDFLIHLKNGDMLVLETKGKDDQQNKTKREFLDEWVRAVNTDGRFRSWRWAVSKSPADIIGIIQKAMSGE
ncbi:MAG: DEAD/DEAH box helicase family protein [Chloroflexota bacterium]|nr:DEAD/DEAH box helicase family protein [Chloroflexota bacterium]